MTYKSDRTEVLLEAVYNLLKQQSASQEPLNLLAAPVDYEENTVSGEYLMNDIGMYLGLAEFEE